MTIKEAINKSFEGGWFLEGVDFFYLSDGSNKFYIRGEKSPINGFELVGLDILSNLGKLVLDIEFWKCLGITEGRSPNHKSYAEDKMHNLIDHLTQGGTITSYFKTL